MFLNVNAADLHVEQQGEGKTVIFIHGQMLDYRLWAPQIEVLKDGFRAVTYDLRGHGLSSPLPNMPFSHVGDLEGLMNSLGIEQAAIVGTSLGGVIATIFAHENPHRTKALVLVNSDLIGAPNDENYVRFVASLKLAVRTGGVEKATARYMDSELMKIPSRKPIVKQKIEEMLREHKWEGFLEGVPNGFKTIISRLELPEIKVPTLIMYGEKDLPRYIQIAKIIASSIRDAGLLEIPDTGHYPNLESTDFFNLKLIEFLESLRWVEDYRP